MKVETHMWSCDYCETTISAIGIASLTVAVQLHNRLQHNKKEPRSSEELLNSNRYSVLKTDTKAIIPATDKNITPEDRQWLADVKVGW